MMTTKAAAKADYEAATIVRAWDLYRLSGNLAWAPEVASARQELHDLIGAHCDTLNPPASAPDPAAVLRAYERLTEAVARKGEAFLTSGGAAA